MNKIILFFACLFLPGLVPAGKASDTVTIVSKNLHIDTSKVIISKTSPDIFSPFLDDKEFIYQNEKPLVTGFWNKLLNKFGQIFRFSFDNRVFPIFILIFFFIVFVLLVILLAGGDFQTLFLRNKATPGSADSFVDYNLAITDFDQLIAIEVERGNLNLAIRYSYLKLLQVLSQRKYIQWKKDKTNRDYSHELSQREFLGDFKKVTRTYEYVWYGKFQISLQVFSELYDNINQLTIKING
jgi:hypothetical protein